MRYALLWHVKRNLIPFCVVSGIGDSESSPPICFMALAKYKPRARLHFASLTLSPHHQRSHLLTPLPLQDLHRHHYSNIPFLHNIWNSDTKSPPCFPSKNNQSKTPSINSTAPASQNYNTSVHTAPSPSTQNPAPTAQNAYSRKCATYAIPMFPH